MKNDSPFGSIMFFVIFLLFVEISDAKPIEYEDIANLLPTEPQTTNDTLAAIVRDPVVQDAVQNAVGNGSLQGLVVKKKVLVMPATEPTKVYTLCYSFLYAINCVNINLTFFYTHLTREHDVQESFINGNGPRRSVINPLYRESQDISSYAAQHNDFYEATETSKTTEKPLFIDNIPREIPYLVPNPSQETPPEHPAISVPIIAFLDPARISNDKIENVPIAAVLSKQDGTLKNQLENGRDEIQRNVQNYVDESSWSVDPNNWQLSSSPSEMEVSSSLYEPTTQTMYANNVNPENLLPITMSHIDIVTPLFWTSDVDINYPKDPRDMEVAADIVFRPLFRYRQEMQRRAYRKSAYRRYNSYNSYPRRGYRYRPRYSDDYY
ncbi:PREDICTED: uncharacterized protein LOC105569309 [Vollenhovia emeryi]|uniref:uncharacterized protein LOC105569309 n=1 Tax=Vollenhovia emeryi TaxID=411798 RepID=UPI0005F5549A|nr:PREDICTED: uncharacterized protein LOC105569309 [Vollenhovia emeryi]